MRMKLERAFLLVCVVIIAVGALFIKCKPLGEGVLTSTDLWERIVTGWCMAGLGFLGGIKYEKKRNGKKEEDTNVR